MRNEEREIVAPVTGLKLQASVVGVERSLSRRKFASGISKLLGLGAFSHFTLLAGKARSEESVREDDECPGGALPDDVCSLLNSDKCPGENPPADWCPDSGESSEDECDTSKDTADTCVESMAGSDQCESGCAEKVRRQAA